MLFSIIILGFIPLKPKITLCHRYAIPALQMRNLMLVKVLELRALGPQLYVVTSLSTDVKYRVRQHHRKRRTSSSRSRIPVKLPEWPHMSLRPHHLHFYWFYFPMSDIFAHNHFIVLHLKTLQEEIIYRSGRSIGLLISSKAICQHF